MGLAREIRRRARAVVAPTLAVVAVGYFALHALQGDRGILAWVQLRQKVSIAEAERARLAVEIERLEARTRALSSDSLDPDLLDERVRLMTGLGRPDEFVILEPPDPVGKGRR